MHERTTALRQLMARRGISARQAGEIVGRTEKTVRMWRCRTGERVIPEHTLEILDLKTRVREGMGHGQ